MGYWLPWESRSMVARRSVRKALSFICVRRISTHLVPLSRYLYRNIVSSIVSWEKILLVSVIHGRG